jgi:hypothetical protein
MECDMASLRKTRKQLRQEILNSVVSGHGDKESLYHLARKFFGLISCEVVFQMLFDNEVKMALTSLQQEGAVERFGNDWKPTTAPDDA